MNGKKARALRKLAESATIGQKEVDYVSGQPPKYAAQFDYITNVVSGYKKVAKGIPTKLNIMCTRFYYKQLKKAA